MSGSTTSRCPSSCVRPSWGDAFRVAACVVRASPQRHVSPSGPGAVTPGRVSPTPDAVAFVLHLDLTELLGSTQRPLSLVQLTLSRVGVGLGTGHGCAGPYSPPIRGK